ncbi:MAG: HpaII family restriction endonuclease [Sulfuricurvum sp.]|uniref:HpaII family restriction endonuclease n=1 Tax=Sulfuricurvum sp. TaxID=2025608 RepID=UPI0027346502|nr:HpaII family restriction endonuclease [Sulfuricurvum sp.]MDP3291325.1 HpaII family restriction endonuclease [Sulfuricurvum sp.]
MAKIKSLSDAKNKGEWSEAYVFLKLLALGEIYAADKNLDRIPSVKYPLKQILRLIKTKEIAYVRDSLEIRVIDDTGTVLLNIPVSDFEDESNFLFDTIKIATGTFEVPRTKKYLNSINIDQITEPNEKPDITIVLHDIHTGLNPTVGFSIKSYVGSAPTLVNASQQTNFIFCIKGAISHFDVSEINGMTKINDKKGKPLKKPKPEIKERIKAIFDKGFDLEYCGMEGEIYHSNLTMVDSHMPEILAELLKLYYSGKGTNVSDLVDILTLSNPLKYNVLAKHPFYEHKIKNFLYDSALGMVPKTPWHGFYAANGGYIAVKDDGEVLAYHIYDKNIFLEYLYNNTKLDTHSTTREKFGDIYMDGSDYFIKLNLSVRFN